MNKIVKYSLIIVILAIISFVTYALLNSGEDDGKRKAIEGTKVNWSLLLNDGSVPGVVKIKVDDVEIYEQGDFVQWIQTFTENEESISNTKKNGYSKIYVKFDKAGYISTKSERTKYDGKETVFYIKTSVVKELIKKNEKNKKIFEEG